MKKIVLFPIALAAVAISCNKLPEDNGDPASEAGMITEVISGSRGASTKVTIADSDASFAWTVGDNIAVHVSNGTSHKYVFTSEGGGASAAAPMADFTIRYDEGYTRDAFAVYPSTIVSADAANYGQSGSPLDVTLPDSYTLAQVSGATTPCPMIATNAPGTNWTFYQLCGLLRLTVNDIPATAMRLEIDFNGKKVCGDFSVASAVTPGTSVIATADDATSDCITITKDGTDVVLGETSLVINIPLPVGNYTNFTVTAYDALTGGNATLVLTRPFTYTASNQYGTKRTASFPSSKTAFRGYEVSAGILKRDGSTDPATYSLTSGAMILTADPVTGAEYYALPDGCNPFELANYCKKTESRGKYYNSWTTLKNELGADDNNINASSEKLPAGWRFPTANGIYSVSNTTDWGRILYGTPKSAITVNGVAVTQEAFAMVTVRLEESNSYSVDAGDYYGFFLLRDGTTIPSGYLSIVSGKKYSQNLLNEEQFKDLIQLGCLFVSSSGYYNGSWRYPEDGHYWASTYYSPEKSREIQFYEYLEPTINFTDSQRELAVRLVKQF